MVPRPRSTRFDFQRCPRVAIGAAEGDLVRWNDDIRMSPAELLGLLERDLPGSVGVEIAFHSGREGALRMTGQLPDGSCWRAARQFDLDRGRIEHLLLTVPAAWQGRGIGATILRNSIALYERLGIHRISLTVDGNSAGSTGGYAWARLGFLPTPEAWAALQPELAARLASLPLGHAARAEAAALIAAPEPEAIRALAALTAPVAGTALGKALLVPASWSAGRMLVHAGSADRRIFDAYLAARSAPPRPAAPRRAAPRPA